MAKMNFSRAATSAKLSEPLKPRSDTASASWADQRSKRQRQIEQWRRARQCLRAAGVITDDA